MRKKFVTKTPTIGLKSRQILFANCKTAAVTTLRLRAERKQRPLPHKNAAPRKTIVLAAWIRRRGGFIFDPRHPQSPSGLHREGFFTRRCTAPSCIELREYAAKQIGSPKQTQLKARQQIFERLGANHRPGCQMIFRIQRQRSLALFFSKIIFRNQKTRIPNGTAGFVQ